MGTALPSGTRHPVSHRAHPVTVDAGSGGRATPLVSLHFPPSSLPKKKKSVADRERVRSE